jgi:hypothetical protein
MTEKNPMAASLPALLDILDHADVARQQREALLAATLTLNTGHTPEDLSAGIEAHLARVPSDTVCGLAVTEKTKTAVGFGRKERVFDFGWDRPKNNEELVRKRDLSRSAYLTTQYCQGKISPYATKRASVVGLVASLVTLAALRMGVNGHDLPVLMAIPIVAGSVSFLLTMIGLDTQVDQGFEKQKKYSFWAFREHELNEYLAEPETRGYLRAVMSSGLPKILAGDKDRLCAMSARRRAEKATREKRDEAEKLWRKQEQQLAQFMHAEEV